MFDSGVSAADLIESLKSEIDVAPDIPDSSYVEWLNTVEQLMYSEIIREQGLLEYAKPAAYYALPLETADDEENARFEDINAVFAGGVQLIRTTLTDGLTFAGTYYKENDCLKLNPFAEAENLRIYYIKRPKLKYAESIVITDTGTEIEKTAGGNVMLPPEFLYLAEAKLRGEAYMLVNEDALAAKWLAVYNNAVETLRDWVSGKNPSFGQ